MTYATAADVPTRSRPPAQTAVPHQMCHIIQKKLALCLKHIIYL